MTADSAALRDVTCVACGCLCDDLTITVREGRIVEAETACEIARRWFLSPPTLASDAVARVEGQAIDRSEAVDRAAEILAGAKAPVILGLSQTTSEAVAVAIAIADQIGAVVEVSAGLEASQRLRAVQRIGRVSATLGEVKNRADVVVFWGVDPVVTHPRHLERYSVDPRGRFVPEGRAGRTVIVVGTERTATAERADEFIRVESGAQFETLWTLRALLKGVPLDAARVEQATGIPLGVLENFLARLKGARYGALFFGESLGEGRGGSANVEAAFALVRDLNAHTRFVALTLGGPGNVTGAEAVLTWQSGCAGGVDFSRGYPRSLAGETSALAMLGRGEADAALIVSEDVEPRLTASARGQLGRIPRIMIAPGATKQLQAATVSLASTTFGIDAGGTVMRTDGVVLPLRPPLTPQFPTDREWLESIAAALNTRLRS